MDYFMLVNLVSGFLILSALAVVLAPTPKASTYFYILQALLIVGLFIALGAATDSETLLKWSITSFVTKVVLVPAMFLFALKKLAAYKKPPAEGKTKPLLMIGLAAIEVLVCYVLVDGINLPMVAEVKLPLAISLAHFFIGLTCIITQRNIFKQVFGYCLMENGSHITLALLASTAPELVEIGVATDAIFAVLIMLAVASMIYKVNKTVDAHDLSELRG
ncbi:MAG: hydrogenase 4 membrane subunit [Coriobacteriales bacterium]|jgi:hydrogenase-4 component E|nr:hydrogenase 4 membrane subunit [Coriobacteriales bacterium]